MVKKNTDEVANERASWLFGDLSRSYENRKLGLLKIFARAKREFKKDCATALNSFGAVMAAAGIVLLFYDRPVSAGLTVAGFGTVLILAGAAVRQMTHKRISTLASEERQSAKDVVELDCKAKILQHAYTYGLPGLSNADTIQMLLTGVAPTPKTPPVNEANQDLITRNQLDLPQS